MKIAHKKFKVSFIRCKGWAETNLEKVKKYCEESNNKNENDTKQSI